jgi:hypothetical protein
LRAEGERALRLVERVDRGPVSFSSNLEQQVMAAVRQRAASPRRRVWRWLVAPREVRLRVRPWLLGPALAAVVAVVVLAGRSRTPNARPAVAAAEGALVRFVFYAPQAHAVAVAGSFNDWSPAAAPLARVDGGAWTITLSLPPGQHEYVFVVDGRRWVVDPIAPAVDDGFGHRNSVVAVGLPGAIL